MSHENTIVIDYVLPDQTHSQGLGRAPLASYTLALLLAQTPEQLRHCDVTARVWPEQTKGDYMVENERPDILCLSFLTTGAPRAYQISDKAKHTKSHSGHSLKIIHGGVHATSLPNESLLHSHIAVRGEVDSDFQRQIFAQALDMEPNEKVAMRIPRPSKSISRPPANWSWMDRKNYIVAPSVQTSVGCPFHCEFCSVTEVFGAAMRAVTEESLRRELSLLPRKALLAIVDDNFLQGIQPRYVDHCLRVVDILEEMGFQWASEVTVKTLVDAQKKLNVERPGFDLVRNFAEHGCRGLFFGIETIDTDGAGLSKSTNLQETIELIRRCQTNGIGILGAFVLGVGKNETPDYAKRLVEFAIETAKLDFAQFSINTPMPGARNFLTGIRDGTIFNFDWELYDAEHCVLRHPRMAPDELEESLRWCYQQFYGYKSVFKRYDLLSLLRFSPGAWMRAKLGLPANLLLHKTNSRWNDRIGDAPARQIVSNPHPVVLEQVWQAIGSNPRRPGDLFNINQMEHESPVPANAQHSSQPVQQPALQGSGHK